MTVRAGAPIEAADFLALESTVDGLEADAVPSVTTTTATVGTVSTGFGVLDVRAATMFDGKLIHIDLYIERTGAAVTATSGNIADTAMFVLATAYRPDHIVSTAWGNGTVDGEAIIQTDGAVYLRTCTGASITTGSNIRLSATYIKS